MRRRVRRRRKLRLKEALLGRSRGGLTSKVHLAADRKCRPLTFVLAADSPQFIPVLKKVRVRLPIGRPPRTRPGAVAADKTYSSRSNHAYLRKCNIKTVIPETKDQTANRKKKGSTGGRPVSHNADLYKERNTVERLINKVKAWRGVATDETGPAGWQAWAESMLGAPPLPVGCLIRFQCAARPRGSLRRLPRLDGPGSAACAARGHTGATAAGPGSGPPTARRSPPSSVPSSTGTTEQGRPGAVRCWRRTRAGSARRPGGPGSCSRHAAS